MRRVLLPGLLAVLLFSGACATSAPTPVTAGGKTPATGEASGDPKPAAQSEKKIGKTITVTDDEDSALVTLVSVATVKEGTTPGIRPRSGTFVVFDLKIEGKTGKFSTNSLYVWMKTAAGKTVKATDGMAPATGADPELPLKDLGPGERASGKALVDATLEPGAQLLWVNAMDKPLASWDL
ncbi:hypothetical protein ACFWY9_06120 [Amycolatopsis sp. NPDC059027]|uniref:hypothetical protein n=1 Tax=unclassified Amycolatopsis TaxID=2618356 RepID=UPI00366CC810